MGARKGTKRKSFLRFGNFVGLRLFYPVRKALLGLLDIKYLTEKYGVKLKTLTLFHTGKMPFVKGF